MMIIPGLPKERYITVQTVAARLSCTESSVYELVRDGKLTAVRIGEGALRIAEGSYEKFLDGKLGEIIKKQSVFIPAEPKTKRVLSPEPVVARSAWMSKGRQVESESHSGGGSCGGGKYVTVTSPLQNYQGDLPEKVTGKAIPAKYKSQIILSVER
jgi:excisionase family DNA binding protein